VATKLRLALRPANAACVYEKFSVSQRRPLFHLPYFRYYKYNYTSILGSSASKQYPRTGAFVGKSRSNRADLLDRVPKRLDYSVAIG